MSKAPGSTVLRQVENGLSLQVIEVETDWARDDIVALAAEEGYRPTPDGTFAYVGDGNQPAAPAPAEAPALAVVPDQPEDLASTPGLDQVAGDAGDAGVVEPTNVTHADLPALIVAGAAHHDDAVVEAAAEARAWLDILADRLVEAEQRAAALADVERLTADRAVEQALLDEIDEQLRDAQIRAGLLEPEPAPELEWDTKTVRAWALEHGVDCPAKGRVPQRVVDAYLEAHAAAA